MAAYLVRLKVTLDDVEPLVMRRVVVPFRIRFDRLHEVLQAAYGWSNSHLYEFRIRDVGFGIPDGGFDDPIDARKATLLSAIEDIGARSFKYLYDFGDGWTHTVKIEKTFPVIADLNDPFLLDAVGRCPPEDVGGPWGYEEFREALANKNHERHDELVEWWGSADYDPTAIDAANLRNNVDALADIKMPVVLRNVEVRKLVWKAPAYHSVMQVLHNPLYAGAYAFGRRAQRTLIIDGRARKANGLRKPRDDWSVLLRDNHEGYITWREYEENQKLLTENAHMKRNCDRKSARGGRALLTGLMRCGRCGRMMRVFYGSAKGNAHRYQCRGDDARVGLGLCIGIGGVRVDRAVATQILEAVSDRAVEAAIFASDQVERSARDVIAAIERDLEGARYEASLAGRRYELVDPAKRHVARELEARWNDALERVSVLERKIEELSALSAARPAIDRGRLLQLAHDLPTVWNAPSTDTRTKQRLIHILVQEIICDLDDTTNEAVLLIHWTGGRHTEVRVARVKTGRYPSDMAPPAVEALRKLGGHWPDRELAVSLNRMLCKTGDGEGWTAVRVRDMRERLGIPEYDPTKAGSPVISLMKAAEKLGICIGSAKSLVQKGILPATQILPGSPWMVPIEALTSEAVLIGVQGVVGRRPRIYEDYQYDKVVRLPGL
ncbi:serine recombinase [Sinorhizobium meliloti]|nr:serine recombinase [Sinorhizobium meliloti]RVN77981.1 serine recombinase [Sinorhizobium meliloti]RVN97723.1 serine recombinase [Sinorhizobium meliloti]